MYGNNLQLETEQPQDVVESNYKVISEPIN